MDPINPNALYVATYDDIFGDTFSPLVQSSNGGISWNSLFGPPFAALAIDPHRPNTLYGGTFDFTYFGWEGYDSRIGVLKSTDSGVSWSLTGLTNTGVESLAIDPLNPNLFMPRREDSTPSQKAFVVSSPSTLHKTAIGERSERSDPRKH